ncbi:MAG: HAD family hydrolase [Anaerolineales bacterium]|nr:MAG: HAD family hydrolase [Anaerolineales bacterium]
MRRAVLFDLGGTLVQYFDNAEASAVYEEAISGVEQLLRERNLLTVDPIEVHARAGGAHRAPGDHRVRPLEERLARFFDLGDLSESPRLCTELNRAFVRPVFARARRYDDTLPALRELRSRGFALAIVSNTPWGSPGRLWRKQVRKQGLYDLVDAVVFCTDTGWRKPAPQIFDFALAKTRTDPQHSLFVGDNYEWDVAGPRAVGMKAVLIDRSETGTNSLKSGEVAVRNLHELLDML